MKPSTKIVRAVAKRIPESWVRRIDDHHFWAGLDYRAPRQTKELKQLLENAGFRCEMNGKPGTEGELIIDVFVP